MKKILMPTNNIIESIKISDIHLDDKNPRLPKSIQKSGEKTILNWIFTHGSLMELMISITENGYFQGEPILIVPHANLKGKYTVVEGNRRLAAVKILNNPELISKSTNAINEVIENSKTPIPSKLPVLKFNDESETLDYLGFRHITGIKQWGPLPKAIYLDKLFKARRSTKDIDEKYRILANIIGSKQYYVKRMHTTYRVFEKVEAKNFYDIPGVNEETIEFSNLNDALTKFKNIGVYVKIDFTKKDPISDIDEKKLKELFKWMFYRHPETHETRVGEVRNLAKLNIILNPENKYAFQAFMKGDDIERAYTLTAEPNKLFTKSLNQAFDRLEIAQQVFYSIERPTDEDSEILKRITDFSHDFYVSVSNKLRKNLKKV